MIAVSFGASMMIKAAILDAIWRRPELWERTRSVIRSVGYDTTDWVRTVMYRECFAFVQSLGPEKLEVLEISGGNQWKRAFEFKTYEGTEYPSFDVCTETLPRQFDLIIADQVFEHLPWPYRAGRNVHKMLKPGGHFIVSTPFLVRVHRVPIDCSRWTPDGLSYLLQECGFGADHIQTGAWGNRRCVTSNLQKWRKRGMFGSLANEPDYPVMVWAFARRTPEA